MELVKGRWGIKEINLPINYGRREQLLMKLEEYQDRIDICNPKIIDMDAFSKIAVLSLLLQKKRLDRSDMQKILDKMKEKYEYSFDSDLLDRAIFVINDYCETGGKNVTRGTGLAKISIRDLCSNLD